MREVIHVDPRFTRTSAMATQWVGIRAGLRHRVPRRHRQLHPRARPLVPGVRRQLHERARDRRARSSATPRTSTASSPAGSAEEGEYDPASWQYEGIDLHAAAGGRERGFTAQQGHAAGHGAAGAALSGGEPPDEDPTLQHPRCVFQIAEAALRPLHAGVRRRRLWLHRRRSSCRSPRRCARTRGASAPARSATRSAGRSTPSASSTSARRRSSSSCSATSAGRAAASSRCAGTRRSRARPTSRRSTTSFPAT